MGARLLAHHLAAPLTDLNSLQKRLECIDFLFENPSLTQALRAV